ncbi:hypothetical protein [Ponticaulis sp.]|uniref:hypothetical protein n=1 Tax=Ponticaulis sp. TaxID=2020902 RepID=UPI000B75A3DA|nr:hypothetical protein [Ponticaulis sp.]MAI91464.1 hypothetical protein [Ponticaulis sp.]OUX97818.1 MAG: hypothetical protein CBB65_13560 [Hyphomonadaceae bacterium TMED5]|tara:strand:- start:27153 stop:27968 length:816 start_codon:yes stop_codon:yes gene_type:complete
MNSLIRSISIVVASGAAMVMGAHADTTVRTACEADSANGFFNCDCIEAHFTTASDGLNAEQSSALADLFASTMSDSEAARRFATADPTVMMSLPLDAAANAAEACTSDQFEQTVSEGEAEMADLHAQADAAEEAEAARVAALGTAPAPREVTDPAYASPLAGADGIRAASEFRDVVIAECMNFGNSPGYCGCHADETAKHMTAQQRRAYLVSTQINQRAFDGEVEWDEVDEITASELGASQDEVSTYRAEWNAMVQSEPYLNITYMCQAYR